MYTVSHFALTSLVRYMYVYSVLLVKLRSPLRMFLAVGDTIKPNLTNLTAVSGVGSIPALATCETSQVLLAGVSGGFSQGFPVFAPPTDWHVSYEVK